MANGGKRGPYNKALYYFPLDVGIFDDPKLYPVQERYGPLGEAVYLRLLCLIYKSGYYYEFESLDRLAAMLVKAIGNRWLRGAKSAKQVILLLAECELFDDDLLRANVLTSAGVQTRYLRAFPRKQIDRKYWLLNHVQAAAPGVALDHENAGNLGENARTFGESVSNLGENADKKEKKEKEKINNNPPNKAEKAAESQTAYNLAQTADNFTESANNLEKNAGSFQESESSLVENASTFAEWPQVLERIARQIKPESYRNWFGPDTVLGVQRGPTDLVVLVADEYAQAYMEQTFTELMQEAILVVTKQPLQINFSVFFKT